MKTSRWISVFPLVTVAFMAFAAVMYAQEGDNAKKKAESHKDAPPKREHTAPPQQHIRRRRSRLPAGGA
jgi:hypothetical protein